jgi:signal transduction histidine kinase
VGIVVTTQLFLRRAIEAANRAGQDARQAQQLLDQSARQLQSANERLEQLSQLKDEFVSDVSHELRTPISSMILHQELLHIHPEKREFYLSTMRRETDRLAHIIEGLLTLSLLDQARVEYKPVPMDLNAIAALYVADREALAESREISLGLGSEPGLPAVEADEGLIGQALGILMTNALNYTPPGGSVTVLTRGRTSDGKDWGWLAVADTGPGIPQEELPHLFERFFRGAVGRSSGSAGTGLGLSIAKEIVDRHQDKLELTKNGGPSQGAEFHHLDPQPSFLSDRCLGRSFGPLLRPEPTRGHPREPSGAGARAAGGGKHRGSGQAAGDRPWIAGGRP